MTFQFLGLGFVEETDVNLKSIMKNKQEEIYLASELTDWTADDLVLILYPEGSHPQ